MVVAAIRDRAENGLNEVFLFLPNLVGALLILIIGWIIARIIGRVVGSGLSALGTDRALATGKAGEYRDRYAPGFQPSSVIGRIAFWFVFGLTLMLAVSALGIEALTECIASVVAYLPNVIAALLILLVAVAIAGAVGGIAQRIMGGTMLGKLVQTAVPVLVITIALFMALVQLKIATQIVVATYVLVLGAISLGFALAFGLGAGLGGQGVAARMLEGAYQSGQEAMPQMRKEAEQAKKQAAEEAEQLKEKAEQSSSGQGGSTTRPST